MAGLIPDPAGLRLRLEAEEVDVLGSLVAGLAERVDRAANDPADGTAAGGTDAPDPILARLTPAGSRGDADVDTELRAMLRHELLDTRAQRLARLADDLREWAGDGGAVDRVLDRDEAMRIVEALNDVRLALASTIGYDEHVRDDLAPDGARADAVALMDALAWLQGGLIEFIEGDA